ncbi:hypothetical protein FRB90_010790 [Tulasnella sp. 427]|nr:hypothetical protein FRB90_010790 [Tulasnella sp. 427]
MPVPQAPYRVALGEYGGDQSWIIQSRKGLIWQNIPDDLSGLLKTIGSTSILDFSLGSGGRYYVKYLAAGLEKRKLSKYLWREIGQDPNSQLDRLTLGPDGQYWGVRRDVGSCSYFAGAEYCGAFLRRFNAKLNMVDSYDEYDFVALGFEGDWAFGVDGRVEQRGSNLMRNRISIARKSGKGILVRLAP